MSGLDPGIHLKKKLHLKTMDGRVKPGHDATEDNPRRAVGNSAIDRFGLPQDCPAADEIPALLDGLALDKIDSSASLKSVSAARSFRVACSKVTRKSASLRLGSKSAPRAAEPKTSSRATPYRRQSLARASRFSLMSACMVFSRPLRKVSFSTVSRFALPNPTAASPPA
jgi:hypothetical protein